MPPSIPAPSTLMAFAVPAAAIALAWSVVRTHQRHVRHQLRRDTRELVERFHDRFEGRIGRDEVRFASGLVRAQVFWAALEEISVGLPRSRRRLLSDALRGNLHTAAERIALRDDSPWRRELAARRLSLVEERASRRALRQALEAGPEMVTHAAAQALGRYRDGVALRWLLAHPEALARRTPRSRVALLRSFGRGALPALAEVLAHGTDDPRLERAVIETLGVAQRHESGLAIERRLSSPDVEVRVAAARALGRLRASECVTSLLGALRDEAWQVRAQAAWALGQTRAPIAIEPLAPLLTDQAWWVRRHAAYALAELGEDGRSRLRAAAYGSEDPYARDMALEVLGGGFKLYRT